MVNREFYMCGIAGILDFGDDSSTNMAIVQKMMDVQIHRGPDGEGLYNNGAVCLGHRRLAIIDIEHGKQPMQSSDRRFCITYNGEIYNFQELAKELEEQGEYFDTQSDTEVVLAAYKAWGKSCVNRFNGDFAFAVWDSIEQTLFLARDRLGVKPLHYCEIDGSFVFSSELKAIMEHPNAPRELDLHSVVEGLTYGQTLAPRTLVSNVQLLEPGYSLEVSVSAVKKKKYWDINPLESVSDVNELKQGIRDILTDATEKRMFSEVPICGLLSGGLDSSVLCTIMANSHESSINTFSVDFEGNDCASSNEGTHISESDLEFAQKVADDIRSNHHVKLIQKNAFVSSLEEVADARDLPIGLGSEVGMIELCKLVKEHATVALSGEGADEVFLGYFQQVNAEALEEEVSPFFVAPTDKYFFIFNKTILETLNPKQYIEEKFEVFKKKMPIFKKNNFNLSFMHYLQIKYVLPYLLDRADRISMSQSIELRVPYCDHRLIEHYFNAAPEIKFKEDVEKYALRESFRGILIDEVTDRKKSVFPYPSNKEDLENLMQATELIFSGDLSEYPIQKVFDGPMISAALDFARKGELDAFHVQSLCSQLITLNYLCKKFNLSINIEQETLAA
jgi:asparagine synthase (glutamine-hydrolysing)